jgi:hypothetical protein
VDDRRKGEPFFAFSKGGWAKSVWESRERGDRGERVIERGGMDDDDDDDDDDDGHHPTRHVLLEEDYDSSDEEHEDDEKWHDRVDRNSDLCVTASRQTPYPARDPSEF